MSTVDLSKSSSSSEVVSPRVVQPATPPPSRSDDEIPSDVIGAFIDTPQTVESTCVGRRIVCSDESSQTSPPADDLTETSSSSMNRIYFLLGYLTAVAVGIVLSL